MRGGMDTAALYASGALGTGNNIGTASSGGGDMDGGGGGLHAGWSANIYTSPLAGDIHSMDATARKKTEKGNLFENVIKLSGTGIGSLQSISGALNITQTHNLGPLGQMLERKVHGRAQGR